MASSTVRTSRSVSDYKKTNHREHVLNRSGMYLGSSTVSTNSRYLLIFENKTPKIIRCQDALTCPALEQTFLEILSNAADNIINTLNLKTGTSSKTALLESRSAPISITINEDIVTVKNGGESIPIAPANCEENLDPKRKYPLLVPEMIFGHLLSSSTYDDSVERSGAGVNGIGAKATNIFSSEFVVKVGDPVNKQQYKGGWKNNMSEHHISKTTPGFTKNQEGKWVSNKPDKESKNISSTVEITYKIDFDRFPGAFTVDENGKKIYHQNTVAHFAKLAFDLSFALKFPISFNGINLDARKPKEYAKIYYPQSENRIIVHYEWASKSDEEKATKGYVAGGPVPIVELIIVDTPDSAESIGFVNKLPVHNGVHIWESITKISNSIIGAFPASKTKNVSITPKDTLAHFSVIVNANLKNPEYTSQTKETLSSPKPKINITPEHFKSAITSNSESIRWGVVSRLHEVLATKERRMISKTDAGIKRKRVSVDQGEDANKAGGPESQQCVLYLVEGESAAAQIKLRISLLGGKDFNGYFPMKGKGLNVTSASFATLCANKELTSIKTLVGLADDANYENEEDVKSLLRYGKVIIASDQDVDGYHIRALMVNMFSRWPSLFTSGRVSYLATPLVRLVDIKTRKCIERFFSEAGFNKYLENIGGKLDKNTKAVYLKGLASSSTKDVEEDLTFSPNIVLNFDEFAKESLNLAFDPKRSNDRKKWINDWKECGRDKIDFETDAIKEFNVKFQTVLAKTAVTQTRKTTTARKILSTEIAVPTGIRPVSNMINSDLCVYSADTLFRAIPGVYDGLKKSQRQALYHALEYWNYGENNREPVKIARLASAAAERVLYQHGEISMCHTLIAMAQNYVGTNNVTVFDRVGQFGTRDGDDAGAPRYISTILDAPVKFLFTKESVSLAKRLIVEGEEVEPEFIPCDLPIGIINGARGIASGYATYIPPYNPVDIAEWISAKIQNKKRFPILSPWFRGFKGKVEIIGGEDISCVDGDEIDEEDGTTSLSLCKKSLITEGLFEIVREPTKTDRTFDVVITELPIGTWTGNYRKMLEEWITEGKLGELIDNSTTKEVKFTLKKLDTIALTTFVSKKTSKKTAEKKKQPKEKNVTENTKIPYPTTKMLKLTKQFSLNQMVTIDENGIPKIHKDITDILQIYMDKMLKHYEIIKMNRIENIRNQLTKLKNKFSLIRAIVRSELQVFNRPAREIEENIVRLKLSIEEFEILKMNEATIEKMETIENKIKELEIQLDKIEKTRPCDIWLERIEKAKDFFKKY